MVRIEVSILISMVAALAIAGCGDDSNDGKSGSVPKKLSAAEVAAGGCSNQTSSGAQCEGIEAYSQCVQTSCASQYDTCLGANYETGDFTGGQCQTYMECVSAAADSCNSGCTIDSACMSCFTSFAGCSSSCTGMLDCTGGGAGTGGTAGTGGNIGGGKTCADFEACCNSLAADTKTMCLSQYNQIKIGGDQVCGAAASIYCP